MAMCSGATTLLLRTHNRLQQVIAQLRYPRLINPAMTLTKLTQATERHEANNRHHSVRSRSALISRCKARVSLSGMQTPRGYCSYA
eukprot:114778-Amphidinium_carterae.1